MSVGKNVNGMIRLRITSADISHVLRELTNADTIIYDVIIESELSAVISIPADSYGKVSKILKRNSSNEEFLGRNGFQWLLYGLKKRVVFIVGCVILAALTMWIPTRVFFWEVKGNNNLPANYIIEMVHSEGFRFGCKRSGIRSEKIKNILLAKMPQLEWVGVTTSGCVATISVSESQITDGNKAQTVGNVVAVCDGVVNSVTVTKGNALCKPGQAVNEGQILISGYEDCGFIIKHTGAEGDVFANTHRTLSGVSLTSCAKRSDVQMISKSYTVRVGKNIIKFSKDSGISDSRCVKMYKERFATLPGGYRLPFSLIIETEFTYALNSYTLENDDLKWFSNAAESYLESLMLGGSIINRNYKIVPEEEICWFRGTYSCTEQIGINRIEENLPYGKDS